MNEEMGQARAAAFARMARIAEDVAETAERSAAVHDEMGAYLPDAPEHAERDRRLAAAERDAAAAYREHRLPSEEVRAVIRDSGSPAGE